MPIWSIFGYSVYFAAVLYSLWLFGILFPFWYIVVARKIWQPWQKTVKLLQAKKCGKTGPQSKNDTNVKTKLKNKLTKEKNDLTNP
jgi:hypothetical protein